MLFANDSDWKPLYETALLEQDGSKLPERISVARNAILNVDASMVLDLSFKGEIDTLRRSYLLYSNERRK